jgi:hypothetical protein
LRDRFKNIIPNWFKALVRKTTELVNNHLRDTTDDTGHKNFIITFHKCGSQWFRTVFISKEMHKASVFRFFTYRLLQLKGFDDRPLHKRTFGSQTLKDGIYGPLYVDRPGLDNIFSDNDRTVVIIRDPRTIIPSWYDSMLKTHAKMGSVGELRSQIASTDLVGGMDVMINHAVSFGTFVSMESWISAAEDDERIKIIRFEDVFSSEQESKFVSILDHFGMKFDLEKVKQVLDSNSFARMTKKNPHYKQGKGRGWSNKLTELQINRIMESCPNTMKLYELER